MRGEARPRRRPAEGLGVLLRLKLGLRLGLWSVLRREPPSWLRLRLRLRLWLRPRPGLTSLGGLPGLPSVKPGPSLGPGLLNGNLPCCSGEGQRPVGRFITWESLGGLVLLLRLRPQTLLWLRPRLWFSPLSLPLLRLRAGLWPRFLGWPELFAGPRSALGSGTEVCDGGSSAAWPAPLALSCLL